MMRIRVIGLSAVVLGVMFSGASAGATPPVTLECGQTVTTSVKLAADLLNCPKDGIVVGASNITIDLNGHRITGPPNFDPEICSCGVNDEAGFDQVTLRSGRIEGFRNGGRFVGAQAVTVTGLVTRGQRPIPNTFGDGNGVVLFETSGSQVTGSTFSDALRGVGVAESSNVLIQNVHVSEIGHSGVALFEDADSTVRYSTIETGGSDWSIEVVNSSRMRIEHNRVRHYGAIGIGVEAEKGRPGEPGELALGNSVENNTVRQGVAGLESNGIFLAEVDGGVQRETTVAHNTVSGSELDGIFAGYANSGNGQGDPPFEEVVGMGPSEGLIEDNLVSANSPDGIHLNAPGNAVTGNRANRNTEWGIEVIEGTIDGGGNTAHHNGQPEQCSGVVCNGVAIAPTLRRTVGPAVDRFSAVGGDRPLRR